MDQVVGCRHVRRCLPAMFRFSRNAAAGHSNGWSLLDFVRHVRAPSERFAVLEAASEREDKKRLRKTRLLEWMVRWGLWRWMRYEVMADV